MKKNEQTYSLTNQNIDIISAEISEICNSLNMRKEDVIRTRLLTEESLLIWQEVFGKDTQVLLKADRLFFKPYFSLTCINETGCNPLSSDKQDFFTGSIMKTLVISPDFVFKNNKNILTFKLPKPERNPLIKLLFVIITSLAIGFLGMKFLPSGFIGSIQENFISPTYNKFLDILGCIAAPLIFFSVTWGVYGIGDTSTLSKLGKGLIGSYIKDVFLTAVCCVVFFPVFGCILSDGRVDFSSIGAVYTMFLDMFPVSIVDPFVTGNTLQIIVLAIVVGIALIYLGKKTEYVAIAIEQFNLITTFLMTAISKLVPFFIAFVLINMIWSGSLSTLTQSWKFILALVLALMIIMTVHVFHISFRFKAKASNLLKKIMPVYLIALATASSSAAFGSLIEVSEKKFGISETLTGFGVPLGIVMHKVATAANNLLIVFYIASINHLQCSFSWIIMAVIVSAIMAIATPPIPGGGAIAYTMLFTQLGLPEESLAIALAMDMLTDFLMTSTDVFCIPFALTRIGNRYDLLDLQKLRA